MNEILYGQSGLLIAVVLLMLMILAIEVGVRAGKRATARTSEKAKSQIETIQASLIGILALVLGFTFSIALDRFNSRSQSLVNEANAIGTTWLRSALLPKAYRDEARRTVDKYVKLRVSLVSLPWDMTADRVKLKTEAELLQAEMWGQAVAAARAEPNPVTTGLYIQSLNETIDAFGTHNADIDRHVPEFVLLLLFGAFIVTGGVIGYTAGLAGHRPAGATYVMIALVVVLMFLVMDLDRPRRGIIHVDEQPLLDVQALAN